jgi:hypothetical protein
MKEIKAIAAELFGLYKHHPSVNHESRDLPVVFRPVNAGANRRTWIDLTNDRTIEASGESLKLTIPASGFRIVEFRRDQ